MFYIIYLVIQIVLLPYIMNQNIINYTKSIISLNQKP